MIVFHTTCLNLGGCEGNAITLAREFTRRGIRAALMVDRSPYRNLDKLRGEGLRIHTLDAGPELSSQEYRHRFSTELKSLSPVLVHSHLWERRAEAFSEVRSLGIEHVVTIHCTLRGTWFHRVGLTRHPVAHHRFRSAFRDNDPTVINISDKSQRGFEQVLPEVRRSRRIYLGVSLPERCADPGGGADGPRAVWIGSMSEHKRPFLAIKIWRRLLQQFPRASLRMIGAGPLIDKVRQHLGTVPGIEITGPLDSWESLGRSSQLLFHTGVHEGTPAVALEGMALGLPVVATASGATSEFVLPGRTGLLAPEDDEDGLFDALVRLASRPEDRIQYGQLGRRIVEEKFTLDRHVSEVLLAYKELSGLTPLYH